MITLKRCFYLKIFFFIWLLALIPLSAFSQQESISSEPPLVYENDLLESIDKPTDQTLTSKPPEEDLSLAVSQGPFLPDLGKVVMPGQITLDDNTLDLIYQFQLDSGIKNFTTFAIFLINKSQKAIERRESKEAIRLAEAAKKMAPHFPHPYWALAQAYGAESKINFYRVIREYLKGHSVALKNFKSLLLLTSNIYFIFCLAFFLSIITFALVLLGKYFTLLAHDIGEFSSRKTYALSGYIWAGMLILVPVILGLGPILVACYWLIILAVYVTRKEKQVIWVIFLILILLPWNFRNAASMVLANQPGIIDLLHRANNEDWSPEIEEQLEAWLMDHPQDTSVLFTLGLINKRQGNYDKAEKYYKNLLEINPSAEKATGNLANTYLAKGQLEKAEDTFRKALEINSAIASFHYNLYRTYLELYKFLEAQQKQELLVARKLDPDLIGYQEKIYSPNVVNRIVIDETLSLKQFWGKAFLHSKEREMVASSFWHLFLKGVPYRFGIFVFILISLLISFLFFQDGQKKFSARCNKCGNPMKKRIRPKQSVKFPEICPHCVSIFIDKHKIDRKIKDRKIDQVEKHQKRQNMIWKSITYVLPGGGHLWIGFPGLGTIYLFIFFGFILKIVFWNGIVRDSLALYVSGSSLEIVLFSVFFLGFYLFVTWNSFRRKESFEDEYDQILEDFSGRRREQRAAKDESKETKSKGKD